MTTLLETLAALVILGLLALLTLCGIQIVHSNLRIIELRNVQRNQDIGYEADHLQSPFGVHAPWYQPTDAPAGNPGEAWSWSW